MLFRTCHLHFLRFVREIWILSGNCQGNVREFWRSFLLWTLSIYSTEMLQWQEGKWHGLCDISVYILMFFHHTHNCVGDTIIYFKDNDLKYFYKYDLKKPVFFFFPEKNSRDIVVSALIMRSQESHHRDQPWVDQCYIISHSIHWMSISQFYFNNGICLIHYLLVKKVVLVA